jgi:hypothetical protein
MLCTGSELVGSCHFQGSIVVLEHLAEILLVVIEIGKPRPFISSRGLIRRITSVRA